MSGDRISEFPEAATITGGELLPVVQNGETRRATASQIATLTGALLPDNNLSDLGDAQVATTNLDFLQSGTGAAARTVRDKLRDVVHAKDFGAVGDGTTDDVVALQAAIDAVNTAGGGIVDCSGGRWLIDSANLNLKKGVYLVGSWRTFGRPGSNVGDFSAVESAFIVNSARTISIQEYDAGIQGMVILRKGLTAPSTIRTAVDAVTAFAGTAITVGDGASDVAADCSLSHLFIVGFAQAVNSDWSSRGRFSYIQGDNTAGIVIAHSYDMQQLSNVHFWPFLTSGFAPAAYAVTGAVSGTAGVVRLTIVGHGALTGDRVTSKAVGGVTGAAGAFIATKIDADTIELQGSVFGGVYTSGGTVYLSAWYRSGIGIHLNTDTDWGQADTCFTYNYATGIKVTACDNGTLMNCGADAYATAADTSTVGIHIASTSEAMSLVACKTAAQGIGLKLDTSAGNRDTVVVTGHRAWGNITYAIEAADGHASFVNCEVQTGQVIRVDTNCTGLSFVGGDLTGVTFSYEGVTSPRPTHVAVKGVTPKVDLVSNAVSGSTQVAQYQGHNSTPATNDTQFHSYYMTDSNAAQVEIARWSIRATDVTAGSMDASMFWGVMAAGSLANVMFLTPTALTPVANDGIALGSTTFSWSDAFLATGGVINWANGNYTITHSADLLTFSKGISRGAPVTKTADFTVAATENWLINNKSGSSCTVTLPTASSFTGREIMIQNYQAQTVVSASSNVVPLGGGAAGTAILSGTAGRWCTLVSNGTNWVISEGVI